MMKLKIYTLLLALSGAWGLQSCDNNDDESMNVPVELQNAFSTMYPNITNVKWEAKAGYYVADFRNGYDASAWFTQDAKWQMTETDIPYSALPQEVKTAFEGSEYTTASGWRIDDVDKLERVNLETVYVIEVENKNQEVDLYYSEGGVLIKSIVDTDDDDDDHYLPEQNAQLTEAMRNFIDTQYPGARLVEVDIEDDGQYRGYTEVDIIHLDNDLKRNVSKEILFDKSGTWVHTSWDVRRTDLPAVVLTAIDTQITTTYPGYRFDDAECIENANGKYYRIELEKNNSKDVYLNLNVDGSIHS